MVNDTQKLVKLIARGYKFIETKFEEIKSKLCNQEFDEVQFLADYDYQASLWEKAVIRILKTYNKENFLIEFQRPSNIKPTRHVYLTEKTENRMAAQLTILRKILTEIEKLDLQPQTSSENVYWIEYTMDGRILLNGKQLRQTQTNSLPAFLFNYLTKNPNIVINLDDIEKIEGGAGSTADLSHTLKDLGFNEEMKRIFFPILGNKKIFFKNPVDNKYLKENHFPPLHLSKIWGESGR